MSIQSMYVVYVDILLTVLARPMMYDMDNFNKIVQNKVYIYNSGIGMVMFPISTRLNN